MEDVPVHQHAADGVVEADARLAMGAGGDVGRSDPCEAVEAEHHAAVGGIAEQLHGALVVGFPQHIAAFVVFDDVVVAFQAHDAARAVEEQVVDDAVADALELDGGGVGAVDAAEVAEAAVGHHMSAGRQRLAFAADHLAGAPAQGVQVTADQQIAPPTQDADAIAGHAADGAAGDDAVAGVLQLNAVEAGAVEHQTFDPHMADAMAGEHGLRQQR